MDPIPVIVVEDEVLIRIYLIDQLKKLGATVLAAVGSGEAAVEKARELKPRLVLMDIRLEGNIDGLAAAKTILAEQRVRIVFMSAYDYRHEALSRLPSDAVDFVGKPVSSLDLTRILGAP